MTKVAVESNLSNVREILQQNGYQVVTIDKGSIPDCECCVISGGDRNMMGIHDTKTEVPVISIQGLTENEVLQLVKRATEFN